MEDWKTQLGSAVLEDKGAMAADVSTLCFQKDAVEFQGNLQFEVPGPSHSSKLGPVEDVGAVNELDGAVKFVEEAGGHPLMGQTACV